MNGTQNLEKLNKSQLYAYYLENSTRGLAPVYTEAQGQVLVNLCLLEVGLSLERAPICVYNMYKFVNAFPQISGTFKEQSQIRQKKCYVFNRRAVDNLAKSWQVSIYPTYFYDILPLSLRGISDFQGVEYSFFFKTEHPVSLEMSFKFKHLKDLCAQGVFEPLAFVLSWQSLYGEHFSFLPTMIDWSLIRLLGGQTLKDYDQIYEFKEDILFSLVMSRFMMQRFQIYVPFCVQEALFNFSQKQLNNTTSIEMFEDVVNMSQLRFNFFFRFTKALHTFSPFFVEESLSWIDQFTEVLIEELNNWDDNMEFQNTLWQVFPVSEYSKDISQFFWKSQNTASIYTSVFKDLDVFDEIYHDFDNIKGRDLFFDNTLSVWLDPGWVSLTESKPWGAIYKRKNKVDFLILLVEKCNAFFTFGFLWGLRGFDRRSIFFRFFFFFFVRSRGHFFKGFTLLLRVGFFKMFWTEELAYLMKVVLLEHKYLVNKTYLNLQVTVSEFKKIENKMFQLQRYKDANELVFYGFQFFSYDGSLQIRKTRLRLYPRFFKHFIYGSSKQPYFFFFYSLYMIVHVWYETLKGFFEDAKVGLNGVDLWLNEPKDALSPSRFEDIVQIAEPSTGYNIHMENHIKLLINQLFLQGTFDAKFLQILAGFKSFIFRTGGIEVTFFHYHFYFTGLIDFFFWNFLQVLYKGGLKIIALFGTQSILYLSDISRSQLHFFTKFKIIYNALYKPAEKSFFKSSFLEKNRFFFAQLYRFFSYNERFFSFSKVLRLVGMFFFFILMRLLKVVYIKLRSLYFFGRFYSLYIGASLYSYAFRKKNQLSLRSFFKNQTLSRRQRAKLKIKEANQRNSKTSEPFGFIAKRYRKLIVKRQIELVESHLLPQAVDAFGAKFDAKFHPFNSGEGRLFRRRFMLYFFSKDFVFLFEPTFSTLFLRMSGFQLRHGFIKWSGFVGLIGMIVLQIFRISLLVFGVVCWGFVFFGFKFFEWCKKLIGNWLTFYKKQFKFKRLVNSYIYKFLWFGYFWFLHGVGYLFLFILGSIELFFWKMPYIILFSLIQFVYIWFFQVCFEARSLYFLGFLWNFYLLNLNYFMHNCQVCIQNFYHASHKGKFVIFQTWKILKFMFYFFFWLILVIIVGFIFLIGLLRFLYGEPTITSYRPFSLREHFEIFFRWVLDITRIILIEMKEYVKIFSFWGYICGFGVKCILVLCGCFFFLVEYFSVKLFVVVGSWTYMKDEINIEADPTNIGIRLDRLSSLLSKFVLVPLVKFFDFFFFVIYCFFFTLFSFFCHLMSGAFFVVCFIFNLSCVYLNMTLNFICQFEAPFYNSRFIFGFNSLLYLFSDFIFFTFGVCKQKMHSFFKTSFVFFNMVVCGLTDNIKQSLLKEALSSILFVSGFFYLQKMDKGWEVFYVIYRGCKRNPFLFHFLTKVEMIGCKIKIDLKEIFFFFFHFYGFSVFYGAFVSKLSIDEGFLGGGLNYNKSSSIFKSQEQESLKPGGQLLLNDLKQPAILFHEMKQGFTDSRLRDFSKSHTYYLTLNGILNPILFKKAYVIDNVERKFKGGFWGRILYKICWWKLPVVLQSTPKQKIGSTWLYHFGQALLRFVGLSFLFEILFGRFQQPLHKFVLEGLDDKFTYQHFLLRLKYFRDTLDTLFGSLSSFNVTFQQALDNYLVRLWVEILPTYTKDLYYFRTFRSFWHQSIIIFRQFTTLGIFNYFRAPFVSLVDLMASLFLFVYKWVWKILLICLLLPVICGLLGFIFIMFCGWLILFGFRPFLRLVRWRFL